MGEVDGDDRRAERGRLSLRVILRETALGYLFWTVFHQLAPAVWWFPLDAMGVTGYESAGIAWFGATVLWIIPPLRSSWVGLSLVRLISVLSLFGFFAPSNAWKLVITSIGNATVLMSLANSLWSLRNDIRRATFWGLMLGYIALLSARIWCWSFMPAWLYPGGCLASFAICLLATMDKIACQDDGSLPEATPEAAPSRKSTSAFVSGSAMAALFYMTYWVFGEVSVLSRWVLATHPDAGPSPLQFGLPVLFFLATGLLFGSWVERQSPSVLFFWWLIGSAALTGIYVLPTWKGYAAGLVLAFVSMSVYQVILGAATSANQFSTMFIFGAAWFAFVLFNIWTVAYNFVPGGYLTRERTDIFIAAMCSLIAISLVFCSRNRRVTYGRPDGSVLGVLFLLVLAGAAGTCWRMSTHTPMRDPVGSSNRPDTIRAGVFTCHFGFANNGWPSGLDVVDFINKTDVDVIAFLESDASKPFLGNNDMTQLVAEKLGMYTDFGANTRDHCWGVNLMSRFPIIYSEHHLLPSPHGEIAPAIRASLDVGKGRIVDIVVTHMGVEEDDLDRKLQAEALSKVLDQSNPATIFLGYITTKPGGRDYVKLTVDGRMHDIDTTDRDRWCQYIFYRGLSRVGYGRVTHAQLSDTELQMGTFHFDNYYEAESSQYLSTNPEDAAPEHRFPEWLVQL